MSSSIIETNVQIYKSFDDMPIFNNVNGLKLLQGIMSHGFVNPSIIQQKAIVPLATGGDMIAQAQSGTGKTGTFVIGTLSQIDFTKNIPQAIIIVHTRELAEQVASVTRAIGCKLGALVTICIGKTNSVDENIMEIQKGCHVIVGTPGRIEDLIKRRAFRLNAVSTLVMDEADKLLSGGFITQIDNIISAIDNAASRETRLQVAIFSATLPEATVKLAASITREPTIILVPQEELSLDGIKQYKVEADGGRNSFAYKADLILRINEVKTIPQCIIYVNNVDSAERLHHFLTENELETCVIHGKINDAERHSIIKDFRAGRGRILISTDLLSRGFDSQHVMLVINFDLPRVMHKDYRNDMCRIVVDEDRISEYIHRIGRSGRYGRKGIAINFVTSPSERACLHEIENYYGIKCEELPTDLENVF